MLGHEYQRYHRCMRTESMVVDLRVRLASFVALASGAHSLEVGVR